MREAVVPTETRRGRLSPARPPGGWFDLLPRAGCAAPTVARARGSPLTVDEQVGGWAEPHRPTPRYVGLRVLNSRGQGTRVLTRIAIVLAGLGRWRRRSVRPLLVFAGVFVR